jgi:hypothetical protein
MEIFERIGINKRQRVILEVTLTDLPKDVIVVISEFLEIYDLMHLSLVCKILHLYLSDQYIWLKKFQNVGLFEKEVIHKYLQELELKHFNCDVLRKISDVSREKLIVEDPELYKFVDYCKKKLIKYASMGFKGIYYRCSRYVKISDKSNCYSFGTNENLLKNYLEKFCPEILDKFQDFCIIEEEIVEVCDFVENYIKFFLQYSNKYRWVRSYLIKNILSWYISYKICSNSEKVKIKRGKTETYHVLMFDVEFYIYWGI